MNKVKEIGSFNVFDVTAQQLLNVYARCVVLKSVCQKTTAQRTSSL